MHGSRPEGRRCVQQLRGKQENTRNPEVKRWETCLGRRLKLVHTTVELSILEDTSYNNLLRTQSYHPIGAVGGSPHVLKVAVAPAARNNERVARGHYRGAVLPAPSKARPIGNFNPLRAPVIRPPHVRQASWHRILL